ncbi:MAG: hypothetical protein NW217_03360 [Hyphomicrobiaceae bacterium]|nr:hypothetical protein [Hyphomicrobiaceae bacterium]
MTRCAVAAAALIAAGSVLSATTAEARRGGGSEIYQQTYKFKQPMHGYEGPAPILSHKYCTYKRFPQRKCVITSSGREKCKIVGWELEQTCY